MFKVTSNKYVLTDTILQQMYEQIKTNLESSNEMFVVFDDNELSLDIRIDKIVGKVSNSKLLDDGLYIDVVPLSGFTFSESFNNMIKECPFMSFNPCMIGDIAPNQDKPPYHFYFNHLIYFIPNLSGDENV